MVGDSTFLGLFDVITSLIFTPLLYSATDLRKTFPLLKLAFLPWKRCLPNTTPLCYFMLPRPLPFYYPVTSALIPGLKKIHSLDEGSPVIIV